MERNEKKGLRVLGGNVAVVNERRMIEDEVGGILVPDNLERKYDCVVGEVAGVGPDARDIEVGDTVYIAPMKGKEWGEYKIYRYEEIFGVIRGE